MHKILPQHLCQGRVPAKNIPDANSTVMFSFTKNIVLKEASNKILTQNNAVFQVPFLFGFCCFDLIQRMGVYSRFSLKRNDPQLCNPCVVGVWSANSYNGIIVVCVDPTHLDCHSPVLSCSFSIKKAFCRTKQRLNIWKVSKTKKS